MKAIKCAGYFFVTVLVVTGLFLSGCRHSREPAASVDPKATAIWLKHEAVFQQALNGHQEDDEFDQACRFFEETTGIKLHLNFYTLGILPTPESEQDLARLRAWYRLNKPRLYWDELTGRVKVRPLPS